MSRAKGLSADAKKRFDEGAPIGLLAAVLEQPRDEQWAHLERLLAAGVKTARQAARKATTERAKVDPWSRRMTSKAADRTAAALCDLKGGHTFTRGAVLIAYGMRLAAGVRTEEVLCDLTPGLADAIRAARRSPATEGHTPAGDLHSRKRDMR